MSDRHFTIWQAPLAAALSLVACYGTLAAVGLLGLLGITIAVNQALWAGTIVVFAGLTLAALLLRWYGHRRPAPVLLATTGLVLIAFTMLASYSRLQELSGFAFLVAGTLLDWRLGTGPPRDRGGKA